MKQELTIELLCKEASLFSEIESNHSEETIFGITDGKAIGTYLENKLQNYLERKYAFERGSSARGVDFPKLGVDVKVTSITQPQSSSPFTSARQKIFGLGYSLLIFVYKKEDNETKKTGNLNILHTVYIDQDRTADYQMTTKALEIIENDGNIDDLISLMHDKNLPVDDIQATNLAKEILENPPSIGYLTISNALQWRLQYRRAIEVAGEVEGLVQL